jgi:hypothetical protein
MEILPLRGLVCVVPFSLKERQIKKRFSHHPYMRGSKTVVTWGCQLKMHFGFFPI